MIDCRPTVAFGSLSRIGGCRRSVAAVLGALAMVGTACSGSSPLDEIEVRDANFGPTTEQRVDDDASAAVPAVDVLESKIDPGIFKVDQFGYRPGDPKVAVIADPQLGYDAETDFTPGERIEVRRWSDDVTVLSAAPEVWRDGATHDQSGDRGWWFDFTEVTEPGSYFVLDPASGISSGRFEIAEDVYQPILDTALKAFWYNRANSPHPADFAGPWSDDAAYIGSGQDTEARSIDDPGQRGNRSGSERRMVRRRRHEQICDLRRRAGP